MTILVLGGAGFIGSNVAKSFAAAGHNVTVVDDLSRKGVWKNKEWLGDDVTFLKKDVTSIYSVAGFDVIFHYAAQVGVQASIYNPRHDFRVNTWGTFHLLEVVRKAEKKPLIIFASTNKVYGDFETNQPVSEMQLLSFCTPYGCSKGAAEQYLLDYYRVFQIPTVVLRMSCIYGNRQFGQEEQGWLAHFMRSKDRAVTIYGDGTQVRDCLYIDDYVRLMHTLVEKREAVKGQVFNIGGGPANTISVNEALKKIGNTNVTYTDWRPSDQRYYVSDLTKIKQWTGWEPKIGIDEGLQKLKAWVEVMDQ